MKKFLLSLGVFIASIGTSAQLVFVDEAGNELADGATVTMDKLEEDPFASEPSYMVPMEGIGIRNNSESVVDFDINVQLNSISNGEYVCCYGSQCLPPAKQPGKLVIAAQKIKAVTTKMITNTEWKPVTGQYGTCSVTYSLSTGRTLNVNFVYADPSSVQGTEVTKKVLTIYDVTGKKVNRFQKGLNLMRYNDGSVKKVIR